MNEKLILDAGNEGSLSLNYAARQGLKTAATWAKFLAILGFIGIGLMVLFGLFFSSVMGMMLGSGGSNAFGGLPLGVFSFIYISFALLYFFPVLYLYRFADKMIVALRNENNEVLGESLSYLGSHYKFIGILAAIMIGLYALVIVFSILAGLASM